MDVNHRFPPGSAASRRAPPRWLRRLAESQEGASATAEASPTERFRLACDLMAFALDCLRNQAERTGSTVDQVRGMHERAAERLRARQP